MNIKFIVRSLNEQVMNLFIDWHHVAIQFCFQHNNLKNKNKKQQQKLNYCNKNKGKPTKKKKKKMKSNDEILSAHLYLRCITNKIIEFKFLFWFLPFSL